MKICGPLVETRENEGKIPAVPCWIAEQGESMICYDFHTEERRARLANSQMCGMGLFLFWTACFAFCLSIYACIIYTARYFIVNWEVIKRVCLMTLWTILGK